MADNLPSHDRGDITNVSPPLPPKTADVSITAEVPELEQTGGLGAGFDVRKKRSRFARALRWLPFASVPVALAVGSWFLGGDAIGGLLAVLGALALIIVVFAGLRGKQPEDLRPRHFLVFGYLLLCWGTWTAVGYFLPLTTIEVEGDGTNGENEPDCPFRVSSGGRVLMEAERARKFSFQMRGRFQPAELKPQTLTAQGWVDRSVRVYSGSVTSLSLESLPTIRIYLDNRGNKEVRLACGRLTFVGAAGGKEVFRIPALPPGIHCPLTLDGKEVGVLGAKDILADALGARSYQFRTLTYGDDFERLHIGRVPDPPFPEAEVFRPGYVHELPGEINYFLEPAPQKITVTTFGSRFTPERRTRTELTEMEP